MLRAKIEINTESIIAPMTLNDGLKDDSWTVLYFKSPNNSR